MNDEIRDLVAYLLEENGVAEHPRGEGRARTFLDDLKSHGYVIEPGWSDDLDAAPRDGIITKVDLWLHIDPSLMSFGFGDAFRVPDCWWDADKEAWVHWFGHEVKELESDYITHWRYPPKPPQKSESE